MSPRTRRVKRTRLPMKNNRLAPPAWLSSSTPSCGAAMPIHRGLRPWHWSTRRLGIALSALVIACALGFAMLPVQAPGAASSGMQPAHGGVPEHPWLASPFGTVSGPGAQVATPQAVRPPDRNATPQALTTGTDRPGPAPKPDAAGSPPAKTPSTAQQREAVMTRLQDVRAQFERHAALWNQQRGYHLEDSLLDSAAGVAQSNSHPHVALDIAELTKLAHSGDVDAQVFLAARIAREAPDQAMHWLEEAAIHSNYTAPLIMMSNLRLIQAQAQAGSQPPQSKPMFDEAMAWRVVAATRHDYYAQALLDEKGEALGDLDPAQQQRIRNQAAKLRADLDAKRLAAGHSAYNDTRLPPPAEALLTQARQLNQQLEDLGDD